jgi:predicted RNA-binding Zn ribbon-like protein
VKFGHYDAEGVALATDVVNTRPVPGLAPDELPDVASLVALLERHGFDPASGTGRPTDVDVEEVRELRSRLTRVFEVDDHRDAVAILNEMVETTGARPRLVEHDNDPLHLHYEPADPCWAHRIAAPAAVSLALVVASSGLSRFGQCADTGCDAYFVDTSKNVSRRFCCQRCAVRTGVAAYRARSN